MKMALKVCMRNSTPLLCYVDLGPLHMSPVTGLARLPGRILSSVHMGNFSPVTGMKKSRKGRETWTEALGTSLSAKFKKVNKDGATFNSYIVRSHRSVINARSSSATTSRGPFAMENTSNQAD